MTTKTFAKTLLDWQAVHGRHDLPWQVTGNPYYTWLSEVMLQQTQVVTVIRYFNAFTQRFPDVRSLAEASEEDVMTLWQGLGYYSRARNLHACAKRVCSDFGGEFPRDLESLESLPGIGRSTAGAIASLSMGLKASILDGNVKRVLCRQFGIEGHPEQSQVKKRLWALADELLPSAEWGRYNQALMDLGAGVCTPAKVRCADCPVRGSCVALKEGRVAHLPSPKAKKPRPEIQALMLLVCDARGRLLLEKQSDGGLWRGLWMPPVIEIQEGLESGLRQAHGRLASLGLRSAEFGEDLQGDCCAPVIHDLTHRRWVFRPLVLRADSGQMDEAIQLELQGFWLPRDKPIPRAVGKVLESDDVRRFMAGCAD